VRKFFLSVLVTAVLGFAAGCGSSSSGSTPVGVPTGGSGNTLTLAVDGGPITGVNYADAAFASAKICVPGSTTSCVTVDHLLVDTGSVGLRVLSSTLGGLALPVATLNGGNLNDCTQFADNSFVWGQVEAADVTLGSEVASDIPIHVLADPASGPSGIPSTCNTGGPDDDTLGSATTVGLGANGILGVGLEPVDCLECDPTVSGATQPPTGVYYSCTTTLCEPTFVAVSSQVVNPVAALSVDNTGVIVELPSVSGSAATLSGSLIMGINTQSNNQLPSSVTVFTTDTNDNFVTTFNGQTLTGSFIDSGSNGLFFPDASITACPANTPSGDLSAFYCPNSLTSLSATNADPNNLSTTKVTNFSIDNAENLFATGDAALSTLGGTNSGGFDWGLPFFYGQNVYVAIDGQGLTSAPWWAY
jgi:Protein of unknown function (DUF3443)